MTPHQVRELLETVTPTSSAGADFLLDLRELLLSEGHAGKCVRCFFGLLGDLNQPGALKPLRHWLEQHLEVEVRADGREVDILPVRLDDAADLEGFCDQTIRTVRFDRSFRHQHLQMRLRFKQVA